MKKKYENISNYVMYFFLYAIIGWLYEVFLEVVIYKWGFSNRGVLFGPWLPVYGFGALIFIFLIYPLIKNKNYPKKLIYIPLVFLGCMLAATALELITSYICELFMGSWPWQTYADYKINFQARIALSPSIRFGLGGTIFLYLLQPLFEKLCNKFNLKQRKTISIIIISILFIDCLYSFIIK
ncbi:MAG: putative ABC transporter permease [Bacilli bacterium]|nr:putative ABC transporter permease [Bacilli bacterium]